MSLVEIDALNVAVVYATDLKESIEFYTKVLGFEVGREMSPGILLFHKKSDLTLYLEGSREPRNTAGKSFPHLSLCFNVPAGVSAALKKFEDEKITVVQRYGDFEGEFAGFQFEDPSGNILEIAGKP